MKKEPRFATEADLCAEFIRWVKSEAGKYRHGHQVPNWTPYAETAGWDILLVAEDGTQIGIQAKLKFNMKVLHQCLPSSWDSWHDEGPDYRAVLVPDSDEQHSDICQSLGLTLMHAIAPGWRGNTTEFNPPLSMHRWDGGWHYWSPRTRCKLPEFVPDVVAGASAPVQLTEWKVAALRIVAVLETRGFVTRQDFKTFKIDPRRWTGPSGWLIPGPVPGQFTRGPSLDFDLQHPGVYAQVLADTRAKADRHLEAMSG